MAKADSTAGGPAVPAPKLSPDFGDQALRQSEAPKQRDKAPSKAYGHQSVRQSGATLELDADLTHPQRAEIGEYSVACREILRGHRYKTTTIS